MKNLKIHPPSNFYAEAEQTLVDQSFPKTDQQLMEINSQLNDVIANIAGIANQVANTRVSDIVEVQNKITIINEIAERLAKTISRQETSTQAIMEGLDQMQSVAARIAAMDAKLLGQESSSFGNSNA